MSQEINQLRCSAKGVGVVLNRRELEDLLSARGLARAEEHILGIGALMALASVTYGHDLDQASAATRLDRHAGNYDTAADQLIAQLSRREQRALDAAFRRLERRHFDREARQRHAVFIGHITSGRLGRQASLLLAAARDAQLVNPDAEKYRADILRAVNQELDRRYPRRDGLLTAVEGSAHLQRVEAAAREEARARDLVLRSLPTLERRVDNLHSRGLHRAVTKTLNEIRVRLAKRALQGWVPDVERYQREVLECLVDEARRAS